MSKRSEDALELERPIGRRPRLARELLLLAGTPNDGPKFAVLTDAMTSAIAAVLPVSTPLPPLDEMLADALADITVALGAAGWASDMERAGHMTALYNARRAFFLGMQRREPTLAAIAAYPPPATNAREATNRAIDVLGLILATALPLSTEALVEHHLGFGRLAMPALTLQINNARRAAERALSDYALPVECWNLIIGHMTPDAARSFAACAQWTRELTAARWRRLIVRASMLLPPLASLPPVDYANVRRVVFDFTEAPRADSAPAMAAIVRACSNPRLAVRLIGCNELVLDKHDGERPPVRKLTVYASSSIGRHRSSGARDPCVQLARAFDLSALQSLSLRGRFPPRAAPLSLVAQLTHPAKGPVLLQTLSIDAEGMPMLERIAPAHLALIDTLRLRDRNGQIQSPMSNQRRVALFSARRLWCETSIDASVVIDALAHDNDLCALAVDSEGVSTGFALSRVHYTSIMDGIRVPTPIQWATQLDIAQNDYFSTSADDVPEANDVWFRTHFPQLPLPAAID